MIRHISPRFVCSGCLATSSLARISFDFKRSLQPVESKHAAALDSTIIYRLVVLLDMLAALVVGAFLRSKSHRPEQWECRYMASPSRFQNSQKQ